MYYVSYEWSYLMLIAHTSPLIFLSRGLEPISEGDTFTDDN